MVDQVSLLTTIRNPPKESLERTTDPFYFNDILMHYNYKNGKHEGKHENLHITLTYDQLGIYNSWQKLFMKNNHCDYYHSQIIDTAYMIKDFFKITLIDAKIKNFEYGCVIDDKGDYPSWMRYKSRGVTPMTKRGTTYGAKFEMTDYTLKGYNKTFEAKYHEKKIIPDNKFRIEAQIRYMKHLYNRKDPINIRTVEDLFDPVNIQLLAQDLLEKYKTIEKMENISFQGLSGKEIENITLMQHTEARSAFKEVTHEKTYKRRVNQYRKLLKNNKEKSVVVEEKIKSKLIELVNG